MMDFLFKNISKEDRDILLKDIPIITKKYPKNTLIFLENDPCSTISFIEKGSIICKQSFQDGHDSLIRKLRIGDIIGTTLLFSSNPYYKGNFYSNDLTIIKMISYDSLITLMKKNIQIQINLLNHISEYSISQTDHIKILSKKTVNSKICTFFYQFYKRNGEFFVIDLTKTQIASYLNIERPSFSKQLHLMIKNKIIENKGHSYKILDLNRLEIEIK